VTEYQAVIRRAGATGPGDAVGGGHDAVAGAEGRDRHEEAVAVGDGAPGVIRGAGAGGPGDAVGGGHDAVAGAGEETATNSPLP
jgi:hypothetical protein